MSICCRRWSPALYATLAASLLSFAGCARTAPEPVTCIELRPPCSLPAVPARPALPSARAEGEAVVLSVGDARRLWAYLERVHAFMRQAVTCTRSFEPAKEKR